MKKRTKIILTVLLLILAVLAALGYWQRDNLKAAYNALTKDSEDIQNELEDVRNDYNNQLQDQTGGNVTIPTLTPEQSEAILNGSLSPEDVKDQLGLNGGTTPGTNEEQPSGNQPSGDQPSGDQPSGNQPSGNQPSGDQPSGNQPSGNQPSGDQPSGDQPSGDQSSGNQSSGNQSSGNQSSGNQSSGNQSSGNQSSGNQSSGNQSSGNQSSGNQPATPSTKADELVQSCAAELSAIQISLMSQLGGMKQNTLAQWSALPESERTSSKKMELAMAGLDSCYALEAQSDRQVQAVLARYESELEKIGASTAPLDTLWDYYVAEKSAQKSYYLSQYLG